MKNMRKLASLLLALVMVLSLATTAFAAEGDTTATTTGSITVSNALVGETYSIYRIFDLESYSGTNYSYKLSAKWSGFTANEYFTVNSDGYVVWTEAKNTADGAAAFAVLAMNYASTNSIANDGTATASSTTVPFTNLPLGYYLVDTSLGSLCALTTTDTAATVNEKNEKPTVNKTVEEDSTSTYGKSNDADITQTVNFKSEITVQKGTENYVLHDTMSSGLTFDASSVMVTVNDTEVAAQGNWTLTSSGLTDGCTFEVKFENSYISTLTAGTKIVVSYSATLNANAVIGGDGNKNETTLKYGNAQTTEKSETVTKTWGVDLFKYTSGENDTKNALAGATFVLYKEVTVPATEEGGEATTAKKYATVENGKLTGWVDTEEAATKLTSGTDGIISVDGLDADTYYFKETAAPAGYNLLKEPVNFVIGENGTITMGETTVTQVEVQNNAGSELPETGGMGTTLFYILGAALMLGAVVLLVTKKRMAAAE